MSTFPLPRATCISLVEGLCRYIDTVILHDFDKTIGNPAASRFRVKIKHSSQLATLV